MLASCVPAFAAPPIQASNPAPELRPTWTWTASDRIEWTQPVGDRAEAVVVGAITGRIDLLDASTGRARLNPPLLLRPGARLAGQPGDAGAASGGLSTATDTEPRAGLVYAFDLFSVTAIDPAAGQVRWTAGSGPDDPRKTGGDPEFLNRIIAAHATSTGVLVVRQDGRIVHLEAKDGAPGPVAERIGASDAEVHARGALGVVLSRRHDDIHLLFVKIGPDSIQTSRSTVKDANPLWSGLVDRGLILATADRIMLVEENGRVQQVRMGRAARLSANGISMADEVAEKRWLVCVSAPNRVIGIDLGSASVAWSTTLDVEQAAATAPGFSVPRFDPRNILRVDHVSNDHTLLASSNSLFVLSTSSGDLIGSIQTSVAHPELDRPHAGRTHGGRAEWLTRDAGGWHFHRAEIRDGKDIAAPQSVRLADSVEATGPALLVGNRVLLQSADRVQAFVIP